MNKKYRFEKFKDSNDAVTGLVVAILLIGLFISILAFIQSVYVPQWMEQKEAEHMEQVGNQFNQLKFAVDILTLSDKTIPVSSPITLGSKEMPFFSSSRSYGMLKLSQEDFKINIGIKIGAHNQDKNYEFHLGSLKYNSNNAYFIDQTYVFENGAMILSQSSGNFISTSPTFAVTDNGELNINLVKLIPVYGKNTASGYGTYPVQTKLIRSTDLPIYLIKNITIYSEYINSWEVFLDEILSNHDNIEYEIIPTSDGLGLKINFLEVEDSGIDCPYAKVSLSEFEVQIFPGWMI